MKIIFQTFFQSISRLSGIPPLYFQKNKKMAYRSGNSQKTVKAKMFLIGPRNLYWPISSNFIWGSQHFHKRSVSHRPTASLHIFFISFITYNRCQSCSRKNGIILSIKIRLRLKTSKNMKEKVYDYEYFSKCKELHCKFKTETNFF